MFTGLVEDIGEVVAVAPRGAGVQLTFLTSIDLTEVAIGDSIAVNGACLTAETLSGSHFTAVAAKETVELTTVGALRPGQKVHLERALCLGDRLGGHLVQGHVDGMGRVSSVLQQSESRVIWVELSPALIRYVAAKGSICVNGVSMTVNELDGCRFRVNAVPHTQLVTLLGTLATGDALNVEVDVLAKYVERLLHPAPAKDDISLALLQANGFMP